MIIETERLILRPWRETDVDALLEYARDPRIGPAAGWPPHTDRESTLDVIRTALAVDGNFAVTLRGEDKAIGSIGVFPITRLESALGEPEIGYWIAVPFWGQGLIPEAVKELMRRNFVENGEKLLWCGHYEGNDKSRRVIEKCGFKYVLTQEEDVPLLGEKRVCLYYKITREDWEK